MWPLPFDDTRWSEPAPFAGDPDARLTSRVLQRIGDDPQLTGERITVEVHNRVVTLSGTVGSLYARVTAADLARSTPGVTDICNRLRLARSAAGSAAMRRPQPDPFDELIANWDDEPHRNRAADPAKSRFRAAAAAVVEAVTERLGSRR